VAINSNSSVPSSSTEVTPISPISLTLPLRRVSKLHLAIDETRWL